MNFRLKPIVPLSLATLMGFAVTCGANAAQSHGKSQMNRQIQTCVSEIGRFSDYAPGSRVMHWVVSFDQLSLAEVRIGIETRVTSESSSSNQNYKTSCVTDTMGKLIDFRIVPSEPARLTAYRSR